MAILISIFSLGYHEKTTDFEKYSPCHRTTVAHFLNKGKWKDDKLEDILKHAVVQFIYEEARKACVLHYRSVRCVKDFHHYRTDMRKSFDGLMAVIQDTYELVSYANTVYLFCRRDSRKLKALHFDKNGFVLLQKTS